MLMEKEDESSGRVVTSKAAIVNMSRCRADAALLRVPKQGRRCYIGRIQEDGDVDLAKCHGIQPEFAKEQQSFWHAPVS